MEEELAALRAEVAELRRQVTRTADVQEIINLQSIYGYYVDKTLYDEAADLFAEDATLEIAGRGLFRGRERIRHYLNHLPNLKYGTLFNHMQLQPVIHVDEGGETASGRWRALIQIGWLGDHARWGEGTMENRYVKRGGVWQIAKHHFFTTYYIEFDQGWDKGGVALAPPLPGVTPDEALTVHYGAFPDVYIPPFHYGNPVTGKAWSGEGEVK